MKIIVTDQAPAAIGPYSQAVQAGGLLFCSGQIPLDPVTGELVNGDIRQETERVMEIWQGCWRLVAVDSDRWCGPPSILWIWPISRW